MRRPAPSWGNALTLDADALIERAKVIISPADAERARKALDRVVEKDAGGALAAFLAENPKARDLLFGVFGSSPYLADLAARDPPGSRRRSPPIRRPGWRR